MRQSEYHLRDRSLAIINNLLHYQSKLRLSDSDFSSFLNISVSYYSRMKHKTTYASLDILARAESMLRYLSALYERNPDYHLGKVPGEAHTAYKLRKKETLIKLHTQINDYYDSVKGY